MGIPKLLNHRFCVSSNLHHCTASVRHNRDDVIVQNESKWTKRLFDQFKQVYSICITIDPKQTKVHDSRRIVMKDHIQIPNILQAGPLVKWERKPVVSRQHIFDCGNRTRLRLLRIRHHQWFHRFGISRNVFIALCSHSIANSFRFGNRPKGETVDCCKLSINLG